MNNPVLNFLKGTLIVSIIILILVIQSAIRQYCKNEKVRLVQGTARFNAWRISREEYLRNKELSKIAEEEKRQEMYKSRMEKKECTKH